MMQSWILLGLVAALGAAGVTLFSKLGLEGMDPVLATTLRSAIMTAVLIAVTFGLRRGGHGPGSTPPDLRAWIFIVLAGISGAISWLAYFGALRIGAAANVAVLDRLSLVLIILFGVLILGERYGWRAWTGVLLIVAGAVLVTADARVRSDDSPPAQLTSASRSPSS